MLVSVVSIVFFSGSPTIDAKVVHKFMNRIIYLNTWMDVLMYDFVIRPNNIFYTKNVCNLSAKNVVLIKIQQTSFLC